MNEDAKKNNTSKYINYVKGIICGVVVTIALMLLFSLLMLLLDLGFNFAAPFATLSVAGGSFAAALVASRGIGSKGYLVGLLTGIIVFLIVTGIALIINKNGITSNTLFHFIIIILASIIGGIVGVNRKK